MNSDTLKSMSSTEGLPPLAAALWHDAHGDWKHAHEIAQSIDDSDGAWVHAYLHRKEGDRGNAAYWYSRAGRRFPQISLEEEWKELVLALS